MKHNHLNQQDFVSSNGILLAPTYHKSGYEVVRALKQALDRAECCPGQGLEQKQFGYLLGVSKSTIHDWFHGKLVAQIQNFLSALERLSETDRSLLLREVCRPCPRLEHPRLAHDTETLSRLRAVLNQRTGLTIVVGPSEPRTFLVTALGHAITQAEPTRRACGLDANRPDTFVPVAGVFYCQYPPNPEQARQIVAQAMAHIEGSGSELVICNGVWSGLSQLPRAIKRLAATRHLLVADEFDPTLGDLMEATPSAIQVMVVSQIPGKQGLIHIDFPPPAQFRTSNHDAK
jgi:hypothetical protein